MLFAVNPIPPINVLFCWIFLSSRKHFIAYCLQMNRTQKQITASIHQVDASWGVHDDDVVVDDDDDDDSDDNDQDFQEEEE